MDFYYRLAAFKIWGLTECAVLCLQHDTPEVERFIIQHGENANREVFVPLSVWDILGTVSKCKLLVQKNNKKATAQAVSEVLSKTGDVANFSKGSISHYFQV